MRAHWRRRVLVLGSLCALTSGGSRALAMGLFHHNDSSVAPTAYVEAVPTAYLAPTSYVVPTSYIIPTTYVAPTSYIVPTSYVVPTAYVEESPAYVSTSYSYVVNPAYAYVAPTSYYSSVVPTTYRVSNGYVPTTVTYPTAYETQAVSYACDPCASKPPCDTPPSYTPPSSSKPYNQKPHGAPSDASTSSRSTPSTVESVAGQEVQTPSSATTEPTTRRDTTPVPNRPKARTQVDPNYSTPPEAPAHDKEAGNAATPSGDNLTPISPAGGGQSTPKPPPPTEVPPVAPGGEPTPLDVPLPGDAKAIRYQTMKPVGPTPYLRTVRAGNLNKLEGKVISGDTGLPEEGVRVTLSNRLNTFVDRSVTTDAFGRYAVNLPDGDWTVRVTMPSGRNYPVSQLSVTGGQIVDDVGRDIPSLTITR